jgi:hypothetical protein
MLDEHGIFIDIHNELRSYKEVYSFFKRVEIESDVVRYSNGSNAGGRWVYQIYSKEFISDISKIITKIINSIQKEGPILEVMSGDGKLSEFLKQSLDRDIIATDSKTSRDNIEYPKWVERLDAIDAVQNYSPSIILMSWEPFYSDTGVSIVELGIPTLWVGDPSRSAVGTALEEKKHVKMHSEFLLGRNDSFENNEFRTEIRLFNFIE